MIPLRIRNATHRLVGSDPRIAPLTVRVDDGLILSRWEPTPEELSTLFLGGSVELAVWCNTDNHPPVHLIAVPKERDL